MTTSSLRQDARVIGLVGLAHGVSHFYHLILAALFPWLKAGFDLTYAECGFLMTVFFVVSGVGQTLAGFVVDRAGPRKVLFAGLALLGVSALVLAAAPNYAMLLAGSMLAGLGNSVFHPADYTLLGQRVSKERMAHAFSVHGISGNLGWAAAPLFLAGTAAVSGWRSALLAAAVIPLAVLALLATQRGAIPPDAPRPFPAPEPQPGAPAGAPQDTLGFLRLPAVWMCFGFFLLTACALGAIQGFTAPALMKVYGLTLAAANMGYTAYMLASAGGMIVGGFIAARSTHHDRLIATALFVSAVLALALAAAVVPDWMAVVLMGAIGFASGIAGPSRDLMIRAAAPRNATGRVFGVVYSGLDSGLALGPLLFGAVLDAQLPAMVFAGIGLFQLAAIATAVGVGSQRRAALPQTA